MPLLLHVIKVKSMSDQAHSQKILSGVLFEGKWIFLLQPTIPEAVKELVLCVHIAHIHEGL